MYFIADYIIFPILYYLIRYRRWYVKHNLQHVFPNKTEKERRKIEKDFYKQFSHTLIEIVYGSFLSGDDLLKHIEFANIDLLIRLAKEHKGVMVMSAHTGNWEWFAAVGYELKKYNIASANVYRKLKSPFFDNLMHRIRLKKGSDYIEKRTVLRGVLLRHQTGVPTVYGMIADQKPSPTTSQVVTQFLGVETPFLQGTELLARKFDYPVMYGSINCTRKGYYKMDLELISDSPKDLPDGEITRQYAKKLERDILENPSMWLWTHNRWRMHK